MSETKVIDIKELKFDEHNFNRHNDEGMSLLEKSIKENGLGRSILLDKDNNIVGGNGVTEKAIELGKTKVRIIETDGTELIAVKRTDLTLDSEQGRKMALADNSVAHANLEWNEEELQKAQDDWGLVPEEWGVELPDFNVNYEDEDAEVERKKKEFEARMEAGELSDDDPEYQEFLKKFAPEIKKTTDDCYTPTLVYDAVVEWVANEYNVSPANFVRPFYPGGDYQKERYKSTDIVVDNPPFSIMSEIIRFYQANGIRFFLFAPHLTLFSGSTDGITCLPVGVSVTYENGANICTSFLTNMEPKHIRFRSEPRLYEAMRKANEVNRAIVVKNNGKMQARYIYPEYLVQTPFLCQCSRLGFDFVATVDETYQVPELDSQKEKGKAIFGKGYLISERLLELRRKFESERYERECAFQKKVEKEKQLKEQAAREEATVWPLSERERKIIEGLK